MLIIIAGIILWSILGYMIGKTRGSESAGCLLGLLLGPIGCLIAVFVDHRPKCKFCGGRMNKGAPICCHCGRAQSSLYSQQPTIVTGTPAKIVIKGSPAHRTYPAPAQKKQIKIVIKK